jgi:hypothetical protein
MRVDGTLRRAGAIGAAVVALALPPARATAEEAVSLSADAAAEWRERYDLAREKLMAGQYRAAETLFIELVRDAPSDADRKLALEMAQLATAWIERSERGQVPQRTPRQEDSLPSSRRSTEEISLLYVDAFLYGMGTGTWFLLQTKPDTAPGALLPFIGFTATSIGVVAMVDGYAPLPRGVPQAVASGLYLGLGEAIWVVAAQRARATGLRDAGRPAPDRWSAETVSTLLWTGATVGGVAGGVIGALRETTPGRVSFTASSMIWSGLVVGAITGAAAPSGPHQYESAFIAGGLAYNAGFVGGLLASPQVAPSVARVRFLDLGAAAGGLTSAGLYSLAAGSDSSTRGVLASSALGVVGGLTAAWVLTSTMPKDPPSTSPPTAAAVGPAFIPFQGGAGVGATGFF